MARKTRKMKASQFPITKYLRRIYDALIRFRVVVVQAETGAGKTTKLPLFLMKRGLEVVCTQPRILAAVAAAEYVSEQNKTEVGGEIGYRTGDRFADSRETKLLYVTDGLQLVRETVGRNPATVLIIDEIHEWSVEIETLLAWCRHRMSYDLNFRIVLMSATLDAVELAKFFGVETPVFQIPGRTFEVEKFHVKPSEEDLVTIVERMVLQGKNVLLFEPGKPEINETIEALRQAKVDAEILPLHADLEPKEQRYCFEQYDVPKVIVATNVAETSVTIPDIDVVIDTGLEKRMELVDGVEGLYLKDISQANCLQRAGRAGRTKEGVYILWSEVAFEDRDKYTAAEILRRRLDQTVLRLAMARVDATELDFFHQPPKRQIEDAKASLRVLGAMTGEKEVTAIGREMSIYPVSVEFARMLVEARQRDVLADVASVVACLEVKGFFGKNSSAWQQELPEVDRANDLLAVLSVFKRYQHKSNQELRDLGIIPKLFWRAVGIRVQLAERLSQKDIPLFSSGDRSQITKSCLVGMIRHVFKFERDDWGKPAYRNGSGTLRKPSFKSALTDFPELSVGLPIDIQGREGFAPLRLLTHIVPVSKELLLEVVDDRVERRFKRLRFDPLYDKVMGVRQLWVGGQMLEEEFEVVYEDKEVASGLLAEYLAKSFSGTRLPDHVATLIDANHMVLKEAKQLNLRAGEEIVEVHSDETLQAWYHEKLQGASSFAEMQQLDLDAMLLPRIEEGLRELVFEDRPDHLETPVGLKEIRYQGDCPPRVEFTVEEVSNSRFWEALPERGYCLPDGTAVDIAVHGKHFTTWALCHSPEEAKVEVVRVVQFSLWDDWKRPSIEFRARPYTQAVIPQIQKKQYGVCPITGEKLIAYGTVRSRGFRNALEAVKLSEYQCFDTALVWTRDYSEAVQWHESASRDLLLLQEAELEHELRMSGRMRAVELQVELSEFIRERKDSLVGNKDLKSDLTEMAYDQLRDLTTGSEISEWIRRAERLLRDSKKAAQTFEEARDSKAVKINHKVPRHFRGEEIVNDGWVIKPDGTHRDPDFASRSSFQKPGAVAWKIVEADELAVQFARVQGQKHYCHVAKLPVDGPTPEQLAAVAEIEKKLRVRFGSFGLTG